MTEVKERLSELSSFLRGGVRHRDWMEKKLQQHPELMTFPLEDVPALIAKGVSESKLGLIEENEVTRFQHALDGFSFGIPFVISETDAVGYWGDVHTSSGKLIFHICYMKDYRLSINASYDAIRLHVFNGMSFLIGCHEEVIVNYVRHLCNNIKNVKKIS